MSRSRTTTKSSKQKNYPPIHPGQILRSEFLEPLGLSATRLAGCMGVPPTRITAIINDADRRAITADTAYRLACVFKTSPQFWMNLQTNYDVAMLEYTGQTERIKTQVRDLATA